MQIRTGWISVGLVMVLPGGIVLAQDDAGVEDDTPPDTELEGRYSIFRYHAVYMPSARAVGRLYPGVGYTFAN
jgi:hypothetical protein